MVGGIRFVMEGPNADLSQKKKRARLITACDACRTKKIKCVQPDITIECEACRRSQTACLFGDRDRYHSERGISTALPHHQDRSQRGSISGYQYIPNQERERAYSIDSWSLNSTPIQPLQSPSSSLLRHSAHLFHPTEPQRPRSDLLSHLLTLFITKLWSSYSFLNLSHLRRAISDPTSLNPVLANGIAALASRLSPHSDFVESNVKKQLYGEPYLHMAKLLLTYSGPSTSSSSSPFMMSSPMDRLHAMLLVAWAEYGNTSQASPLMPESGGMGAFGRMAIQLALELGLDKSSENTGSVERLTWFYVRKLDLVCSWTINLPSAIPPTSPILSRELTPLALEDVSREDVNGTTTLIFVCLNEIFSIHDAISTLMKTSNPVDPTQTPEQAITILQNRLDKFVQHLHSVRDLTFTRENLELFSRRGWSSLLILLHLMYHGTNCISHWPTLFRPEFNIPSIRINVETAYFSALSIVDVLIKARSVDSQAAVLDPFLEVPLAVATRVLMTAPSALPSNGPEVSQDSRLGWSTCMQGLTDLAQYWISTHVVSSPSTSDTSSSSPPSSAPAVITSTPPAYDIYTTWAPPLSASSSSPSRSSPGVTTPPDATYFDIFSQSTTTAAPFDIPLTGSTISTVPVSSSSSTPSLSSASTSYSSSPPPQTPSMTFIPEAPFELFSSTSLPEYTSTNTTSSSTLGLDIGICSDPTSYTFDPSSFQSNLQGWDLSFLSESFESSKGNGEIDLMLSDPSQSFSSMGMNLNIPDSKSSYSQPFPSEAFFMPQSQHAQAQQAC